MKYMRRIQVAGIIILVVLMTGGFVSGTGDPVSGVDSGPGDEVIPISLIPAGAADRTPGDAGADNNVPLNGTTAGATVPAGTATAGLSGDREASTAGASETSARVGRYKTQTLTPYPITIGSGSHPAVISRYPGKVDMFYWNCADSNTTLCHVNTTAKMLGDTNPEYGWESSITPGFFHRYSPAVYSMNASHLGVFFVGWYDGSLYQVQWTQDTGWQPYTGYYGLGVNSTPAAVSRFDGNIELAYVNDTGYVIHRSYNSGVWSDGEVISYEGWFTHDGVSIVSTSPDSFDIFLRRASGTHQNTVERKHWDESGGWSPPWSSRSTYRSRSPSPGRSWSPLDSHAPACIRPGPGWT